MNRLESLLDFAKNHVPFYQRRAPEHHHVLDNWPFLSKEDLATYPLDRSSDLLSQPRIPGGYLIASGGTTAKPKYSYYAHEEVAALSRNIAHSLVANGMEPGDSVVNYFTSGDMWSSFILADKALSTLLVTVFPLGYTPRMDYTLEILELFKPNVIVGVPSMILNLARYCADRGKQVRIPKVFYAGEAMTAGAAAQLTSIWRCDLIRSAGYASSDAGTIGWQCIHCNIGEHYPFDDTVVEIIDDEIVITSLARRAMPIIRYRTGDRGEWVTPLCNCRPGAPRFKLLGRLDNAIIMWGCWVVYDELVAAFEDLNISFTAVQLQAYSRGSEDVLVVKFESLIQPDEIVAMQLRDRIYERGKDLDDSTVSREMLNQHLFFEVVPVGTLKQSDRTGKVIPIIDSRSVV